MLNPRMRQTPWFSKGNLRKFQGNLGWLGGGFKHFLFSPRKLGKIPNLTYIFQRGWFNHQLVKYYSIWPDGCHLLHGLSF